jgi:hypothetical protein
MSMITMAHFMINITMKTQTVMKPIFTTLVFTVFLGLVSFTDQSGVDQVIGALKSGNASELSKYIDDNVELTLPDKSDTYSKAQATVILKDFFTNNTVKNFDVKHKGDGPSGIFCVGTLSTQSGNFRTNVFMKTKNGKEVVKEIRFQSIE